MYVWGTKYVKCRWHRNNIERIKSFFEKETIVQLIKTTNNESIKMLKKRWNRHPKGITEEREAVLQR